MIRILLMLLPFIIVGVCVAIYMKLKNENKNLLNQVYLRDSKIYELENEINRLNSELKKK